MAQGGLRGDKGDNMAPRHAHGRRQWRRASPVCRHVAWLQDRGGAALVAAAMRCRWEQRDMLQTAA
jgi:hypothetical protein